MPYFLFFGLLLCFSACQNQTDLSTYGIDATVILPQNVVVARPSEGHGVVLTDGKAMHLKILPQGIQIAPFKKQIQQNELNRLKKIHQEDNEVLLYESELAGQTEFHFVMNHHVGTAVVLCRENTVERRFTKAEVVEMMNVCKLLKSKS